MSPRSRGRKRKPGRRPVRDKVRQAARARSSASEPNEAPSGRYTPPRFVRFRPTWHKVVGGIILGLGLGIVILNYLEDLELNTMPGPHSELYFLLGLAVAAYSTWWFGWFDRAR